MRNGLPKPVYDEPIISGKPNQWITRVKVGSLFMTGGASSKTASRLDAIEKMYENLKVLKTHFSPKMKHISKGYN